MCFVTVLPARPRVQPIRGALPGASAVFRALAGSRWPKREPEVLGARWTLWIGGGLSLVGVLLSLALYLYLQRRKTRSNSSTVARGTEHGAGVRP